MKIEKTELVAKLNKVKGVVPKRPQMPVLQGVLVKGGYLIANNLEMAIKAKIGGAEGEMFIIPERAFDLINNLPDGEVDISVTGKDTITIKAEKIRNKYQTMEPEQFPEAGAVDPGGELDINADMLLESMRRVSYAVPANGKTDVMSSMCLQASGGYLNFVGLDGHVLAWDRVEYDGNFELLIPKSTVEKLKTLGMAGNIRIMYSGKAAVFATDEFEVYTRLVDGAYFRYQSMFNEQPIHTSVSRAGLLDAMTRAKMCTEEKRPVKFELEGNALNLSIKDKITDYHETLELQEDMAEALTIGFDARLVLETLKAFDCGNIKVSFEGPRMPMVIEGEDSFFRAIVLPVAIN